MHATETYAYIYAELKSAATAHASGESRVAV